MTADIRVYLKWAVGCQIGKKIYFVDMTLSGLFYIDLGDLSVHFVHRFSLLPSNTVLLMVYESAVYFFPTQMDFVMKYDLLSQEEQRISVNMHGDETPVVYDIVRHKNFVYIFPCDLCNGIYVLNLDNQTVEKDKELSKLFQNSFPFWANIQMIHDSHIVLGKYGENQLIEIDLEAKKLVHIKTFDTTLKIDTVYCEKDTYWMLQTQSTDIYAWDRNNDMLQIYKNEKTIWEDEISQINAPYTNMIFLEDEILVLNGDIKNILRIDKEKKSIGNPIPFPEGFRLDNYRFRNCPICCGYEILEDIVLLYPLRGNMLLIYDRHTHMLSGKEMVILGKDMPCLYDLLQKRLAEKGVYKERNEFDALEGFIGVLTHCPYKKQNLQSVNIGQLIYRG